jgi:signal transduction histidine kinase
MKPGRGSLSARAILERAPVQVPDVLEDLEYALKDVARQAGYRGNLAVPMLREGQVVGAIGVSRNTPGAFPDKQVKLLQTFADQAVIAIENVRLFNETKEALEKQTATSEILQAISSSPTTTEPVFEAIAQRAMRLCAADYGFVFTFDGQWIRLGFNVGVSAEGAQAIASHFPMRPQGNSVTARTVVSGSVVNVPDVLAEPGYELAGAAREAKYRAALGVPMKHRGQVLGAIVVARVGAGEFPVHEVDLLKTFADQAVIAIENVRLFNETKDALEQQTATSELLKVIGRSTFDLGPVFETLIESGVKLCGAKSGFVARFDGQLLRFAAGYNVTPKLREYFEQNPFTLGRHSNAGRAALERRTIHNHDVLSDPEYTYGGTAVDQYRTVLAVPMLKVDELLGVIVIYRHEVLPFTDSQIALIETFAGQAVIAIENARLFNETKEALEQQTAISDILRAISESPTDVKPVLDAIADRAARLCDAASASIYLTEDDKLRHVASQGRLADQSATINLLPINRYSTSGRAVLERTTIQVADLMAEADQYPLGHEIATRFGHRSLVVAPLFREGQPFGTILLRRQEVRPFSEREVALLRTFGDQAAIALENTRLFHEIQDKSRQLEIANKHKSDFLANMSHELRTPLNAIIGFSEVLSEKMFGDVNDKQLEYLRDIHSSGHHLLTLINDILDLSKIEAGRMELELSRFDLGMLLDNSMTLVRERATRHGLTLKLDVADDVEEWVADQRKVKQVVINLLSNAVKFTPSGGSVTLRARRVEDSNGDGGAVEVAVVDTGVGIAPEEQTLVFEEFRQASGNYLRKAEGTGLGLSLVKRFVELHGGTIRLESEPGKGSTFAFVLPERMLAVT